MSLCHYMLLFPVCLVTLGSPINVHLTEMNAAVADL